MRKPLVTFKDFSFTYADQDEPILKEINVTIYEGQKVLLVGPSGSGKTTFARCLTGALPQKETNESFSGEIVFGEPGKDPGMQDFLPNELALSITKNAMSSSKFLKTRQETGGAAGEFTEELKKILEWQNFMENNPGMEDRSGWLTKQQVEGIMMAGVRINGENLLIFDEPLANLDPASGDKAMQCIHDIYTFTKTTVIIIEHRLEDVLVCPIDRILVFSDGRIVADGSPDTLLRSDVFSEIGIREPLYITAMRYAGVNLDTISHLSDVKRVKGPRLKEEMENWVAYLPQFRYQEYTEPMLELQNVAFKYPWNEEEVVGGVSLMIDKGEMLSLVGANGAGKSTLSKIMTGECRPQHGRIIWKGKDITDDHAVDVRTLVGYVPQNPLDILTKRTIEEELTYKLLERNVEPEKIRNIVDQVILICGLQYIASLPLSALSFGQLRRVAIASVLVLQPEMIILDEPAAGQDFQHYKDIMNFLQNIHQQGVTVMIITHDIHLMLEYTRRAVVMAAGKLIADTSSVYVLISPRLIEAAKLKETSLFTFAKQIGMNDPYTFTEKFVNYDRVARLF